MIGESVGSYRITEKLGEGGMGVVYAAEHTVMGRRAVVKMLRPHLSGDKEIVRRFFNEARAAARIRHPGIVDVYDVGHHTDGSAFIVMDRLEGESLASRRRRLGRLAPDAAVAIVRQVLGALAAAHAQGIVHRDLKPDNIFLARDPDMPGGERAKILDFGIAKLAGDAGAHGVATQTGAMMGTPVYMSPEQCRGAGEADHRADLYAIGVMLFELLAGRPPFSGKGPGDLMVAHLRDAPPALRSIDEALPAELDGIVATLLAKQPDQRFSSCDALVAALDGATGGTFATGRPLPPASPEPAGFTAPTDPYAATMASDPPAPAPLLDTTLRSAASQASGAPPERRGAWAWLGAGVVVAAAAAGALLAMRGGAERTVAAIAADAAPPPADAGPAECGERHVVLDPVAGEPGANLRGAPSFADEGGNVILVVPNCTEVCELERQAPWVRVRLPDAGEGWVHATRLAAVDAPRCRSVDLPPIDLTPVAGDRAAEARRLHKQGLEEHRESKYAQAIETYRAAVAADPGHLMARYNLSCAYNKSGQTERGLEILQQFSDAGCPVCVGRLIRARSDSEWASARAHPRFVEITRDVLLAQPSPFEMANQLAAALAARDLASVEGYVHPRDVLTVKVGGSKRQLRGVADAYDWLAQTAGTITAGEPTCRSNCCRFGDAGDGELALHAMCTDVDSGSVRTLTSIDLVAR